MGGDQPDEATVNTAGKTAVVTGGAGGLGAAIASRLAEGGCRLALLDADASALAGSAASLDGEPFTQVVDITDYDQVRSAAAAVAEHLGRVDILVNAAGVNTRERTLGEMSPDQWHQVIAVNLNGVFNCVHAFLDLMRTGGGGTIVTIVSTAARLVSPGAGTHYSAAKRALLSLTESVNIEQGRYGIRACALSPGEVNTPLVDKRPDPPDAARRAAMLQPADVAEAVYYVVTRPPRVTVGEIVLWPSAQISGVYSV